jgi:hypothetical protein
MSIDITTGVGKIRYRIGDVSDIPFLSDEIIQVTINDNSGNLPAAAQTCAQYVLAQLAFKSHKKMVQLEIWGAEAFANYRTFLIDTISNPALMSYTALPYLITDDQNGDSPLKDFVSDWNSAWWGQTVTERLHDLAGQKDQQTRWWEV